MKSHGSLVEAALASYSVPLRQRLSAAFCMCTSKHLLAWSTAQGFRACGLAMTPCTRMKAAQMLVCYAMYPTLHTIKQLCQAEWPV